MRFADRADAGVELGKRLQHLKGDDVIVLGLPRGGVPIAFEVARTLRAMLDVIIVRKIRLPFQPELAMGAVGEDGIRIVNEDVIRAFGVNESEFDAAERRERLEIVRRVQLLRTRRPTQPLVGRTVVVVDDGVATGSSAQAACKIARVRGAKRIIFAAPVATPVAIATLATVTDEIFYLKSTEPLTSVGQWYTNFSQTSDSEVLNLLNRAAKEIETHMKAAED